MNILVVDDEKILRVTMRDDLADEGHLVAVAASGEEALEVMEQHNFDVVLTDFKMPGMDGLELLKKAMEKQPAAKVILMTAFGTTMTALESGKLGGYDYITKPFTIIEFQAILNRIEREKEHQKLSASRSSGAPVRYKDSDLVGKSLAMLKVYNQIDRCIQTDSTVLITGETGTGKEIVSTAIHNYSKRREGPIVRVSCGILSKEIIESELFGHEKGAFTTAVSQKIGRFELANGGTIFLDDIDDTTPGLQFKLLRVLEERSLERVGSATPIDIDVRVIAATKLDLLQSIETGEFRKDLYYRLNVMPIHLPPLRNRADDVAPLVEHFLAKNDNSTLRFDPVSLELLSRYSWPGNVRELRNVVERLCNQKGSQGVVTLFDLPEEIKFYDPYIKGATDDGLRSKVDTVEYDMLVDALNQADGNKSRAAKFLGLKPSTFRGKLIKHGII